MAVGARARTIRVGPPEGGPRDGLVDRWLNRRCSRRLTPVLVRAGLTPNAVTALALAIGLAAAFAFAAGGYAGGIAGALLLQLSVVLDCCDGELARWRGLESRLGDHLDVLADNVVHVTVVSAIAARASADRGDALFLVIGGVAVLGIVADTVLGFVLRARAGAGGRLRRLLDVAATRDFSVLVFAMACVGRLEWILIAMAIGCHVFWGLALVVAWRLPQDSS